VSATEPYREVLLRYFKIEIIFLPPMYVGDLSLSFSTEIIYEFLI